MSTITKQAVQAVADLKAGYTLGHADVAILNELARIALASLEAEAVCVIDQSNLDYLKSGSDADVWPASRTEMGDVLLYRTAPPAPVYVPAAMEMDDDFDSSFEHGKAVGWNAYRAAMLQGAEPVSNRDELRVKVRREHAEWSQATFGDVGPVGPLKHLSKEALEAAAEPGDLSEWADMQFLLWDAQRRAGISDGEITAAMEEKLKVNMARQWPEPKDGEPRLHIKTSGNSPVIPGCSCLTCRPLTFSDSRFVVCPECGNKRCPHANDHRNACTGSNEPGQEGSAYPAAPQQEVTQALAKGMERYGDAMQKLADSGD